MGYYTDFTLTVKDNRSDKIYDPYKTPIDDLFFDMISNDLKRISGYAGFTQYKENTISLTDAKWYDWESHMTTLTLMKEYRDILFILDGEGEESGDIWRAAFKNGKSQILETKITYSEITL